MNKCNEDAECESIDNSPESSSFRSTKRPTKSQVPTTSKRQKREAQEGLLLEKAISVMEKASNKSSEPPVQRDSDDIFGEFVTSELRTIEDTEIKRQVKFQIQSLLFSAQSNSNVTHQPATFSLPLQQQRLANSPIWEYPPHVMQPSEWSTQIHRSHTSTPPYTEETSPQNIITP